MPDSFPSYTDWLSGHSDDELVDLLWRLRAFRPGSGTSGAAGSGGTGILSSVSDVAALRQLTALQLGVLHALVVAGAAHGPVTAADIAAELSDLCDTAGTPPEHRPDDVTVAATVPTLARWGLVFGPGLSLSGTAGDSEDSDEYGDIMVPAHLPALFAGATDLPWVLVDGYRCPVPTDELPGVLEALPGRHRRLLETLENSGGIGHSATLDDPERPLARMIAAGLLDRIDTSTARLSPRVSACIAGRIVPQPGGDFTDPGGPGGPDGPAAEPSDATDATAVARVVETVRLVADVLTVVGRSPLRPLNAGGVGVREIARLSKALGLDNTVVSDTLELCRHADLIAPGLPVPAPQNLVGSGDHWSLTERGADYLTSPLARRWALLLDGWRRSAHAPWLAEENDAHLLQDSLDVPSAAALRGLVASSGGVTDVDGLWRRRPSVAAVTTTDALDHVRDETVVLGLTADGEPSSAAVALAGASGEAELTEVTELTEALGRVLPPPVQMLIIQADMTILAPGLLDSDTEAMLKRFADVESTGMASVWRVTRESMQRAVEHGDTAEQIQDFLAGMAPDVPQSLWYLIQDTWRTHHPETPVVGSTAASVLTAPDTTSMDAIMDTDAAAETGLRRIAPTVAVSSSQLSLVVEALEEDGIRISVDGDGTSGRGTAAPVMSTVPDPQRPATSRDEVADDLAGAVEGFRRARQSDSGADGTGSDDDIAAATAGHSGDTVRVREPRAIMAALRTAYDAGTSVEISYVDRNGDTVRDWISVVTMSPVSIVGVTDAGGESLHIQPHRVAWVATPTRES